MIKFKSINREHLQIELRKVLIGDNPDKTIIAIKNAKLLSNLFKLPEGYYWWEMDQNTPYHSLNVWEHTITALENLQKIINNIDLTDEDKFVMNLAILLHDTGKLNPEVHGKKTVNGKTRTTYYGHERHSAKATKHILAQLPGIQPHEIVRVQKLIEGSGRVNPNYIPGNEQCDLSGKALGKFVIFMCDDWQNAIFINMADATSKKANMFNNYDFTYHSSMMAKIRSNGPKKIMNLSPLLSGNEIANIIDKERGPWIRNIIAKLVEWQLKNPKSNKKDAEGFVLSFKDNI